MSGQQKILDDNSIRVIIKRLTYEIAEDHLGVSELGLIGLNSRGSYICGLIQKELSEVLPDIKTEFFRLDTEGGELKLHNPINQGLKHLIVVDDVLNSGKTAFLAASHCYHDSLISMEMAFLAVREHRSFPVYARYTGRSIATTIKEHVYFDNAEDTNLSVYLH